MNDKLEENRAAAVLTSPLERRRGVGWLRELRLSGNLYLMVLPGVLGFLLFNYIPMYGIIIAFKQYDLILGFDGSPWVGLKHFQSFFADPYAVRVVKNTLLLGLYSLLFGFWPPILLALLLNELTSKWWKKFFQSVSYLPHFIAMVVVVGMMMELLGANGPVNLLLGSLGMEPIAFFNESSYFRTLFVGSGIWQGIGWGSILYLAALTGIDPELYEASYMDGANRFRRIWHISLPGMLPTITILFILHASDVINVGFEKAYLMSNPAIYEVGDVIQTYVYRRGIIDRNFSYATAVGLLNSVAAFLILYVTNRASRALKQNSLW
ncbi:ABC transporter permease subunit [Paenibacillus sp. LMG 31461]|uniref:ABC transporter permease subunit n=1 Tax=Paenibacillus plantarum TaxID=2654975 RepID=A0ABX1X3B3_9BACL|nr:ABC transporter permease subunit [Paenibacillus plantarum]NOU62898.1 ABC transporter permease subunit [Paenibacillus plantarum]